MASAGEGASECKFSLLKISIHCEGCKKKIHRVLRKIEGVEEIKIDGRQNQVTVKGPVDAPTLIHRLKKSGKHAEVWHDKKKASDQFDNKSESKESSESSDQTVNAKKPMPFNSTTVTSSISTTAKHADVHKAEAVVPNRSAAESKETKAETEDNDASKEVASSGEVTATASKEARGDSGNGSNGEKMDKKADINSPHPPAFPPQVMSYNNMAQPSISQSYYVSPVQPAVSQGYTYVVDSYPPPQEYYYGNLNANSSSASGQQSDPYTGMFSDENPNVCSLM